MHPVTLREYAPGVGYVRVGKAVAHLEAVRLGPAVAPAQVTNGLEEHLAIELALSCVGVKGGGMRRCIQGEGALVPVPEEVVGPLAHGPFLRLQWALQREDAVVLHGRQGVALRQSGHRRPQSVPRRAHRGAAAPPLARFALFSPLGA